MIKSYLIALTLFVVFSTQVEGYRKKVPFYQWKTEAIGNTTSYYTSFNGTVVIPSFPGLYTSFYDLGVVVANAESGAYFDLGFSENNYLPVVGVQVTGGVDIRSYFPNNSYLSLSYIGSTMYFGGSYSAQDNTWTMYMGVEGGESTQGEAVPVIYGPATDIYVYFYGGEIEACSDIGTSGSLEIDVQAVTTGAQSNFVVENTYSGEPLGCDVTVKPDYPTFTFTWDV